MPFGAFFESVNTDITRKAKPQRRPGRVKIHNGAVRTVWGDGAQLLFVDEDNALRRLDTAEGTTVVRAGVDGIGRLAAARVANTTYWSCGDHMGVIENGEDRAFGLGALAPAGIVSVGASDLLPAGRYAYAWAVVSDTAGEGPIIARGTFELADPGGVGLVCPTDSGRVRAFVTEPGGSELYRLATIEAAPGEIIPVTTLLKSVRPQREDLSALPPFTAAGIHNGRMLVAWQNLLLYSPHYDYEYFNPASMFVPFESRVNIIAPVERGVFIGTETEHYFLRGDDIAGAARDHKANYGALAHSLDYLEQKEHAFEGADARVAVWMGQRGPVFGLPGGRMEDSGDGLVTFPSEVVHAAGAVRKREGDMHYVSVVRHRAS